MFLLSIVAFLWTVSAVGVTLVSWVCGWWKESRFLLERAEIAIVDPTHESGVGCVYRVDVTKDMQRITQTSSRKVVLLPRLLNGRAGLMRRLSERCTSPGPSDPRRKKAPICFLDVWYTYHQSEDTYRCLYPLYSMSTKITYPPHPIESRKLAAAWTDSAVASALLTLRSDGESTRRLSCDVTDRIKRLQGPRGDFHRHSQSGYQLQKHILNVVLMPDIQALRSSFDADDDDDDDDAGVLVEESPSPPSAPAMAATSSGSLKSLSQAHGAHPPVSIRVQFRKANNDVRVMHLEKC